MMVTDIQEFAASKSVTLAIQGLLALAQENKNVIDLRFEFAPHRNYLGVYHYEGEKAKDVHLVVMVENKEALKDLLELEDKLIDCIGELKDKLGEVA
ncbi:hypothetical protein [Vibrio amylolyticus]|uniref:hypothetical protein n=1 Tax=Vibrio amylolyticus TaxID=2847292 RepID=UPI00354CBE80